MRDGLSGLAGDASAIADMLRDTTETVDCAQLGSALAEYADGLAQYGTVQEVFPEQAEALLRDLFDAMLRGYTMAREREVHRAYSEPFGKDDGGAAPEPAEDDDDDGLF